MSTEEIDERISSRPFQVPDEQDVINVQAQIDKIELTIENLDEIATALGEDHNWQIISKELYKRLVDIAMKFFTEKNPTDPAIQTKYAIAYGQFHEVLRLTAQEIGVKSQIQRLETEKKSVMETMKTLVQKVFSKNEKEETDAR